MGLITYTFAGGALLLIGAWESLATASHALSQNPSSPSAPPQNTNNKTAPYSSSSTVTLSSISVLSFLFVINSLVSLYDAVSSKDSTGVALQLEIISIAFLFLLYSLLGILSNVSDSFRFPRMILDLMFVFAFIEEFMLFYMQRKDPSGIENHYYDLTLVPVAICLFSTILEIKNPKSSYPRLARGIGFVLQGMWTLQMGFSFYSNIIANGCALHEKSKGNYTIKCKGHMEYHRGRAIATLQFNCHLALIVTLVVGVYAIFCKKYGISREFLHYKPLGQGGEMRVDNHAQFSLDSDDEDDNRAIKEVRSVELQKAIVPVPESIVNGYSSHV